MKETDRRVKYTKMVIKQSFISLLKQKPISKITVKEICACADLNRATFYAHYTDQYHLLSQIEEEFTTLIIEHISKTPYGDNNHDSVGELTKVLEYIKENPELCCVLFCNIDHTNFRNQLMMIVQQRLVSEWTSTKALSKVDAEYIYTFASVGCVGVIQKWMVDGMDKSAKEVAELVVRLMNNGIVSY